MAGSPCAWQRRPGYPSGRRGGAARVGAPISARAGRCWCSTTARRAGEAVQELVAALLAACPRIVVLVTSRTPLGTEEGAGAAAAAPELGIGSSARQVEPTCSTTGEPRPAGVPESAGDLTVVKPFLGTTQRPAPGDRAGRALAARPAGRRYGRRDRAERRSAGVAGTDPVRTTPRRARRLGQRLAAAQPGGAAGAEQARRVPRRLHRRGSDAVADADPTVLHGLSERALIRPPTVTGSRFGGTSRSVSTSPRCSTMREPGPR